MIRDFLIKTLNLLLSFVLRLLTTDLTLRLFLNTYVSVHIASFRSQDCFQAMSVMSRKCWNNRLCLCRGILLLVHLIGYWTLFPLPRTRNFVRCNRLRNYMPLHNPLVTLAARFSFIERIFFAIIHMTKVFHENRRIWLCVLCTIVMRKNPKD